VLMLIYDGLVAYIKYAEGFSVVNGVVLAAPSKIYSSQDQFNTDVANAILNLSWTLKSSSVFLALAVWNYAVCNMVNLKNFHKSLEFKTYTFWSLVSFVLYPILAVVFQNNALNSTVAPQFVYHCECFLEAMVMIRTNRKFLEFCEGRHKDAVVARIHDYIFLNRLLIFTVLADGVALFIVNVDIISHPVVAASRVIYNDKFATDFLSAIFSAGFVLTFPLVVLNLHPAQRSSGMGSKGPNTINPRSSAHDTTENREAHAVAPIPETE